MTRLLFFGLLLVFRSPELSRSFVANIRHHVMTIASSRGMTHRGQRLNEVRTKQAKTSELHLRLQTRLQLFTMLLFRAAASLLPAVHSKNALFAANASTRLFTSSRSALSSKNDPTRGRTAGEMGDDAAQSMQGAEGKAAGAGVNVEEK